MALKPITLRLDEEEYDKLKAHLGSFWRSGYKCRLCGAFLYS